MIESGKPQRINGGTISNYTGTIDKTMATPRWLILLKELTVLGWVETRLSQNLLTALPQTSNYIEC